MFRCSDSGVKTYTNMAFGTVKCPVFEVAFFRMSWLEDWYLFKHDTGALISIILCFTYTKQVPSFHWEVSLPSQCVFLMCHLYTCIHSCPCMTVQACGQLWLPQPHWGLCASCWQDWSCRVGLRFSLWVYPRAYVYTCCGVLQAERQGTVIYHKGQLEVGTGVM